MKMKQDLIAVGTSFLILFLSLSVSCTTINGESRIDVARVAGIAGVAAHLGSVAHLNGHPNDRSYFVAAYNALGALDHAGNYDPAQFAAALQALPIKELQGPQGNLYILAAVFLWDELAQQSIALDRTLWVKPVLVAVRAGIGKAIGVTPGVKQRGYIP